MLILDDYIGVKLWGENIFRRLSNHLINNHSSRKKEPLLYGPMTLLDADTLKELQALDLPDPPAINTTILGKWEGHYSTKSTLYYNDLSPELQRRMMELATQLMPTFEALVHSPLEIGDSNFKATILRYEGPATKFDMHYDTEHPDSFRCLIVYRGSGKVPPFCFERNGLQTIHMGEGDGVFFRGSTTYHGVFPTHHADTIRYVVGFQYQKKGTLQPKTLNSELRGKSVFEIVRLFMPYVVYYQCISRLIPFEIPMALIPCFFHMGMHTPKSYMRLYAFVFLCTFKPVYSLLICSYFSI